LPGRLDVDPAPPVEIALESTGRHRTSREATATAFAQTVPRSASALQTDHRESPAPQGG
jgi:hypothetical protein